MKKIVTHTITILLLLIGAIAFLFLIGDEAPDAYLSLWEFFILKTGAFAVLAVVVLVAKNLYKHGLLADWLTEE